MLSGIDPRQGQPPGRARRQPAQADRPAARAACTIDGAPGGGWWNYGGILADVYLRKVDRLDFGNPVVRPMLPTAAPARRGSSTRCRSPTTAPSRSRRHVETTFGGQRLRLRRAARSAPGQTRDLHRHARPSATPHLWSPGRPVPLPGRDRGEGRAAARSRATTLQSGIRSLSTRERPPAPERPPVNLRGGFVHLDDPVQGGAVSPEWFQGLIDRLKSVGGTTLRTHYPFTPLHARARRPQRACCSGPRCRSTRCRPAR